MLSNQKGIAPLIIILILAGVAMVGVSLYAATLPQKIESESVQTALPEGTATSDEILVGFRPGVARGQMENIHEKARSQVEKNIPQLNVDVVKLPQGLSVPDALEIYKGISEVEFAEPNFLASAFLTPNDPLFTNQWNLKKIGVEEAYDAAQGGSYLVAIVDTGVDNSHPDLSDLVIAGYNTIDENDNTGDDHGHGTHVAGIASAQTDNATGVASISYRATILPVKVLNKDGWGTYADVSEGIVYASDKDSVVINLSLGGSSDSETLKKAVRYAQSQGSILVAAAGNNGNDAPVYPAAYPGVLAVSASDQNDNLASFSSFGGNIFVASPGVSITSSVPGGSYKQYSGTSMSAPHLSGLIALTFSAESSLGNSDVINRIKEGAEKVGPYPYDENGWNPYFGYGRISAAKTISSLDATTAPSPTESTTTSGRLPQKAQVPKEYQFSFELQGVVENTDVSESKFTTRVEGGTPEVMTVISGNLVDVYIDRQSRIKYQGREIPLSELTVGSRVNVKGNVFQNKLFALEVLVQYKGEVTQPPVESLPGGANQESQSQTQSQPAQQDNPSQNFIPEQAQDKGKVQGVSTNFLYAFLQRVVNFFQK